MGDYAIYFLTLVLGVAIFYVFNALDSQQAMLDVSASKKAIIQLMLTTLSGISVFVSFVLGFLIVYANNFLIKRRKKEFGVYMTLGMSKNGISRILLGETVMIGLVSLGVGLVVGVFASQLMSILVAKLFEADMTAYTFSFSPGAAGKTVLYFGIMYVLVILFNVVTVSKYQLIDLLTAGRKNEETKLKNPLISVILFLVSIVILTGCYLQVTVKADVLSDKSLLPLIAFGSLGTFLFFWSLSGFFLRLAQKNKRLYYKELNAFVLRQLASQINTAVVAMTVICLMLFLTIGVLSCGMSLNQSLSEQLETMAPRDLCIQRYLDLPEDSYSPQEVEASKKSTEELLGELGFSAKEKLAPGYIEVASYQSSELTWADSLKEVLEETGVDSSAAEWSTPEDVMSITEYNRAAELYGMETFTLSENEYLAVCTFDAMTKVRNMALAEGKTITLDGKTYQPKYRECKEGYVRMAAANINAGIIVLPDSAFSETSSLKRDFGYFIADYKGESEQEKQETEAELTGLKFGGAVVGAVKMYPITKLALYESSVGLSAIVTFIAIYLGVIFLISGAAILALKQLSESSDNKARYQILKEIGADQRMIRRALFGQIGIFFLLPYCWQWFTPSLEFSL